MYTYFKAAQPREIGKPQCGQLVLSAPLVTPKSSYTIAAMAANARIGKAQVKGLLKAELKRRNLSYADLADKLVAIGVRDNERNISSKTGAGASLLFSSCNAWRLSGCRTIHLENE
jgi:hypothetical protein